MGVWFLKKYLSIGEVAKLKGVGIKSLRYYDKLGILSPAYINPDTGYRYYLPNQLILVDLISFCIRLGIPLKDFSQYIQNNQKIDMETFLEYSRLLTQKKMQELTKNIRELEHIAEHLYATQQIKLYDQEYTQEIDTRYFYVKPLQPENYTLGCFTKSITSLYQYARDKELNILHNHGILDYVKDGNIKSYAFLEVEKSEEDSSNILEIPNGIYNCLYFSDINIFDAQKYNDLCRLPENRITIIRELYDIEIKCTETPIEIQTTFI